MERYRIHADAAVYFVAYSIVDWLPVFVSSAACDIVINSMKFCCDRKDLRISGYVIMPTHIHAILFDADFNSQRLVATLNDFRKYTGRSMSDFCINHLPHSFMDTLRSAAGTDRERRFWQASRHPEAIETEPFWKQKLDYMHENPCHKGLVRRAQDWRYSSAAYYVSDGQTSVDVPITMIDWN